VGEGVGGGDGGRAGGYETAAVRCDTTSTMSGDRGNGGWRKEKNVAEARRARKTNGGWRALLWDPRPILKYLPGPNFDFAQDTVGPRITYILLSVGLEPSGCSGPHMVVSVLMCDDPMIFSFVLFLFVCMFSAWW
jgi:hypothetical protein